MMPTPIVEAAAAGDLAAVMAALSRGESADAADPEGRTPLGWAAVRGHRDVAEALLVAGADPWKSIPEYGTPIELAAGNGNPGVLQAILARVKPVVEILLAAVHSGSLETVDVVLAAGISAGSAHEPTGTTPLVVACDRGHGSIASRLLQSGADPNARTKKLWTPLMFAARGGHETIADALLVAGADVNATNDKGSTALISAAGNGHDGMVRRLLEAGAKTDPVESEIGGNALIAASVAGSAETVRLLLDAGMDPAYRTPEGSDALYYAASGGKAGCVRLLLERGAPADRANRHGETPLLRASAAGSAEAVLLLLDAHADPNSASGTQRLTPLMVAADRGHLEVARMLLSRGADPRRVSLALRTACDYARLGGHSEVEALLAPPARDVPVVKPRRKSPHALEALMNALWAGDFDAAVAALEEGAPAGGAKDQVPLIAAAHAGHVDLVRLLLANGAEADAADPAGFTALAKACGGCHVAMARALLESGAKITQNVWIAASLHRHPGILALLEERAGSS